MRSDRTELMTEGAIANGIHDDHLDRVRQAGRLHPPQRLNVCVINSVAASGDERRSDASETRGIGENEVDYSQLSIRSRVEPGPDHDRVRADFVGRRGGGLHRLSDHGRRHHQLAQLGRRQSLIASGRKQDASCFLPGTHSLATRESFYELDDQDNQTVSKPTGSNDDGVCVDPGHHRNRRRVTLQDFRHYRSIALKHHRQFAVGLAKALAAANHHQLENPGAPAIQLARAPVRSLSHHEGLELGDRIG